MFAAVSLSLPQTGPALTLPVKAVFVEDGRSFVYVQVAADSPEFVRRGIETVPIGVRSPSRRVGPVGRRPHRERRRAPAPAARSRRPTAMIRRIVSTALHQPLLIVMLLGALRRARASRRSDRCRSRPSPT